MKTLLTGLALLLLASSLLAEETYLSHDAFLRKVFSNSTPVARTYWLTPQDKVQAEAILQHRPPFLRVRYWQLGQTTAWVLEEIGKEKPITIGIAIDSNTIRSVDIMAFRESRGWEVRYPFFTDQFSGARLGESKNLDRHVDGITGATLSVSAVVRSATLALYLAQQAGKSP